MKYFIVLFILLFSINSLGSEGFYWYSSDGEKAPNTKNQKSVSGFGGWLLVTPDRDWAEKWNTPREDVPNFSEAEEVVIGEELTILPFFANPRLDQALNINISCDIKIRRPDGSFSINEVNVPCAQWKLEVDPMTIFLTQTVIKYVGEAGDPFGKWIVYFNIKDNIRGVSIPLETSFRLVKDKINKSTQPSPISDSL